MGAFPLGSFLIMLWICCGEIFIWFAVCVSLRGVSAWFFSLLEMCSSNGDVVLYALPRMAGNVVAIASAFSSLV